MVSRLRNVVLALLAPMLLTGCLFLPGKFTSTMHVGADRSFAFTYTGEVVSLDLKRAFGAMLMGMAGSEDGDGAGDDAMPSTEPTAEEQAETDAQMEKFAAALREEPGFRTVEYRGKGMFYIDYAMSGTLTHSFVFPFNSDAAMVFPFVAAELRGKDGVSLRAPGFAFMEQGESIPGFTPPSSAEGTFTFTTDAQIVEQNSGADAVSEGGKQKLVWNVTPESKDPPMVKLKVAALP